MASQNNSVVTGEVRFSFVHIFKPYAITPESDPKYSLTCLLPKTDTVTKAAFDQAIANAIQRGAQERWGGIVPPIVPNPIHDGDGVKQDGTPFGSECKGHWVFTATSKQDYAPDVAGPNLEPILDQSQVYSGCYGRVSINVYPYLFGVKKGIGFGLGAVQKLRDGEPLGGGGQTAKEAFGAVPVPQQAVPQAVPQQAVPQMSVPQSPYAQVPQVDLISGQPIAQ